MEVKLAHKLVDHIERLKKLPIPEEKKKLITKEFAEEFVLRLKDLYSGVDNHDNQTPSDWFKDTGAYLTFTSIWNEALEKTAENFGCSALYEYYNKLE